MDSKVEVLNRELKRLDPKYFAKRGVEGLIYISKREAFALRSPYSTCFALTDDWTVKGNPVDRGITQILHKLKFGEDSEKVFGEMDRLNEQEENSRRKAAAGSAMEIADRMHYDAKKAWSGVNTSLMDKKGVTRHGHY